MAFGGCMNIGWRHRAFPCLLGIVSLAALSLEGQGTDAKARRTLTFDRDVETAFVWHNFPRWNAGMLVGYDRKFSNGPIVVTIDGGGRRDETLFTLQDAAQINIVDVAASTDGEIAIVASAVTADARGATILARIASDRKRRTVTRTWPYCPMVVTFAPDGTIWTIGHLKDDANTNVLAYNVLRRFDRNGKMLGSTTLRVKGSRTAETSYLIASRDRVGWFTREREYVEFSMDGSEIARYDWPEKDMDGDVTGAALSEENDAIACRFAKGKVEFFALDRGARTWDPVSLSKEYSPTFAWVVGFDGTTLVTTNGHGKVRRFSTE